MRGRTGDRTFDEDRIPLVVGIAGDALPEGLTREAVGLVIERSLAKVRDEWPGAPHVVLCPRSPGLPEIVADVVRTRGERLGFELYVVAADDPSADDAAATLDVRTQVRREARPEDLPGNEDLLGMFVAKHANLLLAFATATTAGMAERVVDWMVNGVKPQGVFGPVAPLGDSPDVGPAYIVRLHDAARDGEIVFDRRYPEAYADEPETETTAGEDLTPKQRARFHARQAKAHRRVREQILTYNQDLASAPEATRNDLATLVPNPESLGRTARFLWRRYERADDLAIHLKPLATGYEQTLLLLAFLSAVAFEWVTNVLEPSQHAWLLVYPAILVAGTVLYLRERVRQTRRRRLDYRALAEGLRVQFFWHLGGVQDSVADHYLRFQRTELTWINETIRSWNLLRIANEPRWGRAEAARDTVSLLLRRTWLEGQHSWFRVAMGRNRRALIGVAALTVLFVVAGFVLSIQQATVPFNPVVITAIAVMLTGMALLNGFTEWRGMRANQRRYAWIATLIGRVERRLDEIEGLPAERRDAELQQLVVALGKEALFENGSWLLLLRQYQDALREQLLG